MPQPRTTVWMDEEAPQADAELLETVHHSTTIDKSPVPLFERCTTKTIFETNREIVTPPQAVQAPTNQNGLWSIASGKTAGSTHQACPENSRLVKEEDQLRFGRIADFRQFLKKL